MSQSNLTVYLAARFSRKNEIKAKSLELIELGINVTSRWLDETADPNSDLKEFSDDLHTQVAQTDIEDIDNADLLVLFTEDPELAFKRGGRHFESGYAYGKGTPMVTVGPKENVFHHLPKILNVDTWEELKANLKFLAQVKLI